MAHFNIFLNNDLFFKVIDKCQKEILRCAPPSSHVCNFQRFQFISQFGLKFRYVFQLRSEIQFYKAINMKCLKIKAFSPDTEVIIKEQVIEMLDKLIMLNHGQIMLSKSENLITLCIRLLSILSYSSIYCSSEFSNCMFSQIVLIIL